MADIVDLMLATGARFGEILALRWEDLDLAAERPTLTIYTPQKRGRRTRCALHDPLGSGS